MAVKEKKLDHDISMDTQELALKTVSEGVNRLLTPDRGFVIITHYQRMLDYITPDVVHIFLDGRIVESGGATLADTIEETGYDTYRTEVTTG